MMHATLIAYIQDRSTTVLSANDISLINKAFIPRKIKKRQMLLREGTICRYISFVVRGALRQYTMDEKGKEHILQLLIENWWASDRESFHTKAPSIYNIDAWEDSELLLLPSANGYYHKVNEIPAFKEMRILLDDNNHIASQRRLHLSKDYSAEDRYQEFKVRYPEFLHRFPQHMIASYLGVTKETLSRIRNQPEK